MSAQRRPLKRNNSKPFRTFLQLILTVLNGTNQKKTCVREKSALSGNIMRVSLLKSKIHRAAVTGASLDYEGSLLIAEDLAQLAGFAPYERILVSNMANGERFETYVIYGPAGSGAIELNGAAAHLGKPGDRLTIMGFGWIKQEDAGNHKPKVVLVNEKNEILRASG